ncbi:ComEC/Rec2 family competence protein [Kitasatospora sp. NPDC057223]|uniref:ComEC/Rec2 family competence protein n=1 Tax=Kitasatospora sp. NPDC057223 TaxID=3346055 RepID=UPI003642B3E3
MSTTSIPSQGLPAKEWERLEAVILDVGQGNCAIVRDGRRCLVVDVASEIELLEELQGSGVKRIEHLIISHADDDHVRGALKLLPRDEISIGTLWFNPDGSKNTRTWRAFINVAHDLFESGKINVSTAINVAAAQSLSFARIGVEVLHPDILFSAAGPDTKDRKESKGDDNSPRITSNGMSVTLRIHFAGQPALLLPGDLDSDGLERIILRGRPLEAPVLVFPHHGGGSGALSAPEFTKRLCDAVKPTTIIASMGRGHYRHPLPEVVSAIREALPQSYFACTQISSRCHGSTVAAIPKHLVDRPAAGRGLGASCAGTIVVAASSDGLVISPEAPAHAEFVGTLDNPMCNRPGTVLPIPRQDLGNAMIPDGLS